jgi:hypothetical protein
MFCLSGSLTPQRTGTCTDSIPPQTRHDAGPTRSRGRHRPPPSGQGISQHEMLRRLFEHIDDRVESVKTAVAAQQTRDLEQSQMALLAGQADNLASPPPYNSR